MALPALAENLHIEEPRVFINNGKAVTTSQDVADYFNKLHKDVLKKINLLDCSPKFNERNFAPVDYVDAKGEKRPMFEITKDGFVFLVMGFTGKKAAAFKEAYIAEFNRMEAALTYPNYSQATLGDLTGTAATAELAAVVDKLQRIIHEGEFIPAGSRRNYNLPANRKHEQTIIRDFLTKDESSALLMLLAWLRADGFDMTAAEREIDIIRGYVGSMRRSMGDIQTHAQYIEHAVRLVN